MPNRLAREKSPYLLQHANNPVDWYPWGEEAFARARAGQKPIFLSIGYSTCHWCHVMEHESFEDGDVAARLNRDFVPVKVDREERPDIDRVYMAFVQATTGSGGWPMSVWLTPDLKPFYGGTYFPPTSRWGRPGFSEILDEIARAWREDADRVRRSAESLTAHLRGLRAAPGGGGVPGTEVLDAAVAAFRAAYDHRRGGFGQAPKFPRPSELLFLLREHVRTGEDAARDMALGTLQAMAIGGMRDHVGGGFHRYSVDAEWRVPHFEKMLYDQAQLVLAYLEAAQLTGEPVYADVASDTLDYVLRDLTSPEGAFFSAEDADSVPPDRGGRRDPGAPAPRKLEGAFYLWEFDEVADVAGDDADLVRARFGIEPEGNAPFDPHDEFGRGNLLYVAQDLESVGRESGLPAAEVAARLERARLRLREARSARPRPHLDDKVLAAWNGLMIAAFARAARVLGRVDYLTAARRAAGFIHERLWSAEGRTLLRRYRDGDAAIAAYADDYANVVWGLIELFQADGDGAWLEWALDLQARQDELFWDDADGGWFATTGDDPSVLLRMKDDYDGAEPSASAVGAHNLLALAHLTGDTRWAARLDRLLGAFGTRAAAAGRGVPMLLAALSAYHAGVQQVVVAGPFDDPATWQLAREASSHYLPFAVLAVVEPGRATASLSPAVTAMTPQDGRPAAYVCRDFACQSPVTSPDALAALLRRR